VELLLGDEDLLTFRALIQKKRTTVDVAWGWMTCRGHSVSRGAVFNYIKHTRGKLAAATLAGLGRTDAELRRSLRELAQLLSGSPLASVALHANELCRAAERQPLEGFKPADPTPSTRL
jgi:hypothetical protein